MQCQLFTFDRYKTTVILSNINTTNEAKTMIDLGQYDRTIYSRPKKDFKFHLINELTGDIVATFDERPRLHQLENNYPNLWDHYKTD